MSRKHQRATRRASSQADVRHLLKTRLDWMRGFPDLDAPPGERRWRVWPRLGSSQPACTVKLTRDHLARATRGLYTLLREHPKALADEVGDAPAFARRTEALLEQLKASLYRGAPLPTAAELGHLLDDARAARHLARLARLQPPLAPLLEALGWAFALEPRRLGALLRLTEAWAPALGELLTRADTPELRAAACEQALTLVELGIDDDKRDAAALLATLASAELRTSALEPGPRLAPALRQRDVAVQRLRERRWPAPPPARAAAALDELLGWLHRQPARVRRSALALHATLFPIEAAGAWARWHAAQQALFAEARALLAIKGQVDWDAVQRIAERMVKHEERAPVSIAPGQVLALIRTAAELNEATRAALLRACRALPPWRQGRAPRLALFSLWMAHLEHGIAEGRVRRWARALAALVNEHGAEPALGPWASHIATSPLPSPHTFRTIDRSVLESDADRVDAFFTALDAALRRGHAAAWPRSRLELLVRLVGATGDGVRAERLFQALTDAQLVQDQRVPSDSALTAALALCPDGDAPVPALVEALDAACLAEHALDDDDPLGVAALCRQPRLAAALRRAVLRGDTRRILALGARMRTLRALDKPLPMPPDALPVHFQPWMEHYPRALGLLLAALAAVDAGAESSARRALGRSFPDPKRLAGEITTVRAKLRQPPSSMQPEIRRRLAGRLANLERRLRSPDDIKPGRLAKLASKLEVLVEQRALSAYQRSLEAPLRVALGELLAPTEPPDWCLEPPTIDLLPHLLALEAPSRRLAVRVLRARAGPYPWDLRHEPANASFLERLARRGIDPAPWLDGIGVLAQLTPKGRVLAQLERDPLEVLLMGKHFETCLSPGAFNFFSAVSNAADINKRVLYARDEHGAVVGRALLALTDGGQLLSFHIYSHDPDHRVGELVARFALELTERMGTQLVTRGKVSTLLSHHWYDDGPEDPTGALAPLMPGSALRRWLPAAPLDEVPRRLERELAPLGLNALTLPLLLDLPELELRPELATVLLDAVEATRELPLDASCRAAELAWRAGAKSRAARLLQRIQPALAQRATPARPPRPSTLELLVEIGEPSAALRLLLQSRPRGLRRWLDEPDPWRVYVAARAHETLHRRKLAATLYARAAEWSADPRLRQACRERLAAC